MQIWRRRRHSACQEAGEKCEFNVARAMVYNSPAVRVFRVRCLVCGRCGERVTVAKKQDDAFVPASRLTFEGGNDETIRCAAVRPAPGVGRMR